MRGSYGASRPPSAVGNDADLAEIIASGGEGRIGTDESGKGDYFGPLVVAAV